MKFRCNPVYFVLAIVPLLVLIYFVVNYEVNVPYQDQWELVPLLEKSYQGTLSISDLWVQHNEHRPLFPLIIMLVLARFSSWNLLYELVANIMISAGTFLTIIYQLKKTERTINNFRACWAIPVISIIVFSLSQGENWLWGWQIAIFLNVFAVTVGIVLLANYAARWLYFILALLMGIIATYSFSTGLIYWVIGLLILFLADHPNKRERKLKIIIWVVTLFVIICTYMYKYQKPVTYPFLLLSLSHPIEFIKYVLVYLGAPVCLFWIEGAVFLGLFGLVVWGYLIWILMKSQCVKFNVLLPYVGFGLYSIGSAMATGIGRVGMGASQALSPRYVTISLLLWVSTIVFFYLLANVRNSELKDKIVKAQTGEDDSDKIQAENLHRLYSGQIAVHVKISLVIVSIVLVMILNADFGRLYFKNRYYTLLPAMSELRRSERHHVLLSHLYPYAEVLKARRLVLEKYKLSVFRLKNKKVPSESQDEF
jgi:hypothetical protein